MSDSVKVPAANVVISFNYDLMANFAVHGSLAQLKKEAAESGTTDIGIFDNSVNSTLISLDHKYNRETDGAVITVEFVDPTHSFEDTTLAVPFDYAALLNITSPLDNYIRQIEARLASIKPPHRGTWRGDPNLYARVAQGVTNSYRWLSSQYDPSNQEYIHKDDPVKRLNPPADMQPWRSGRIPAQRNAQIDYRLLGLLRANISDERNYLSKTIFSKIATGDPNRPFVYNLSKGKVAAASKKLLLSIYQDHLSTGINRKPVYIAYGLGNNIKRDWCSPQCFGTVIKAEYSFDGTGARTLKLAFAGHATIGGVLTKLGTTTLGEAGAKVVTMGKSYRLFNLDNDYILMNKLDKLQTEAENRGDLAADYGMHGWKTMSNPKMALEKVLYPPIAPSVNRFWSPSFHMAFCMCMSSYIRAAIPETYKDNVVVLLPNLDKYLATKWKSLYDGIMSHDNYKNGPDWHSTGIMPLADPETPAIGDPGHSIRAIPPLQWSRHTRSFQVTGGDEYAMRWFHAYDKLADQLGLTLTAGNSPSRVVPIPTVAGSTPDYDRSNLTHSVHVAARVFDALGDSELLRLSLLQNTDTLADWWADRQVHLMCENNFITPFADKLKKVGQNLTQAFAESTVDGTPPVSPQLYIETDLVVLQALGEAGLIKDPTVPAVIWADAYLKLEFLDARVMEVNADYAIRARQNLLNYSDILRIPDTYYKTIFDHFNPVADPGLFGGTSKSKDDLTDLLGNDPNVKDKYDAFTKKAPSIADRIPVFTLGVKSPNVLKIDLDLNNVFTNFIQTTKGVSKVSSILNSQYILRGVSQNPGNLGGANSLVEFFTDFAEMKAEKERREASSKQAGGSLVWIPAKFEKLIEPIWVGFKDDLGIAGGGFIPIDNLMASLPVGRDTLSELQHSEDYSLAFKEQMRALENPILEATANVNMTELTKSKQKFYQLMWTAYSDLYSQAGEEYLSMSYVQQGGKNSIHQSIRQNASIVEKMMQMQLVGNIETLPMFSLSNTRLALNRSCLLYSREPRFSSVGAKPSPSSRINSTWFSGMYTLYGWHHKISSGEATSSFSLSRDLRYSG